ncbi:MAG: hypothetical protein EP341_10575, partial [Sphingomonadales bacterium]
MRNKETYWLARLSNRLSVSDFKHMTLGFLPPISAVIVAVFLFLAYRFDPGGVYKNVLDLWLVQYNRVPFLDAAGIASAIECERLGFNTYIENPCDMMARPLVYPPLWKLAAAFPIEYPASVVLLGVGFTTTFLVALFFLPKVTTVRHQILLCIAMVSPPVGWAIVGGSNDMLIFAMAVLGLRTAANSWPRSAWGYAVLMVAGALKYYPVFAIVVAGKDRLGSCIKVLIGMGIFASVVAISGWGDWNLAFDNVWNVSPFTYVYGIENIGGIASRLGLVDRDAADLVKWLLVAAVTVVSFQISSTNSFKRAIEGLEPDEGVFFVGGAALVVSTYLLTQNIAYREILLLTVFPGLLKLSGSNHG